MVKPKVAKTTKAAKREKGCIFCKEWTPLNGLILFTVDGEKDRGICEECIRILALRLHEIFEHVMKESLEATKH